MSGIADNQGEVRRNGFLGFGSNGRLSGFGIAIDDELERALSQKGVNLPVEIVDVMLGPFNL
jgi:hypothetical protein